MRLLPGLLALLGLLLGLAVAAGPAWAEPQAPCPPGSQWSPRLQRCVAAPACPPGSDWSPRLKRCVSPEKKCPPGHVWVPGQGCRPVPPPPPKQPRGVVTPPPPEPAPRYQTEPANLPAPGALMVVRASALNLRDCPTMRCQPRAVLSAGQEVKYLDYRHGYALVRVLADPAAPPAQREGWVDFRYLAPAP